MVTIISGIGLLLLTLAGFSLFSLKMPKGQAAMSGMANAAIATFLIEAVHRYITGDLLSFRNSAQHPEVLAVLLQRSQYQSAWVRIRYLLS